MDCGYVRRHTVAQSMLEQPHRRRKRKRRRRRRKHTKPYPLFQAVQGNWPIFCSLIKSLINLTSIYSRKQLLRNTGSFFGSLLHVRPGFLS